MRRAFIKTLLELAQKDKDIYLLTGDLGFSVFEEFKKKFPNRFINCGVAEQNLIGVAAGLALKGKKVFVYSIIPFITLRCLEQIRNDICLHNLNVKIVGVGAGFSYGAQGPTHHAIEDLGVMRSLANLTIFCPADPIETELVVKKMAKIKGPVYLRLGKSREENIYSKIFSFKTGKANLVKEGKDIAIIGIGPIIKNAILATEELEKKLNISIKIISMTTLKPLDRNIILKLAEEMRAIFTIEEHSLIGGLGSAVAEVLAESNSKIIFKRIALPDNFCKEVGTQEYLREKNNLSVNAIKKNIEKIWKLKINTN
jgi:transketolase